MFEQNITPSIDVGDIVDQARSHWAYACACTPGSCIELYAKVAHRSRIERGPVSRQTSLRVALESGVAARVWTERDSTAGFAAAAGFSRAATATVVNRALEGASIVASDSPEPGSGIDAERWDVDATEPSVSRGTVDSVFAQSPLLDALELGTTVEVLVGPGGWFAARRRQRAWVIRSGPGPRLAARRGFKDWVDLSTIPDVLEPATVQRPGRRSLLLRPHAAAPIISALTSRYFVDPEPPEIRGGEGWSLSDDPIRVDGLAGGTFDDAGFPSHPRELVVGGRPTGSIWGPGTLWRRSFRQPPTPGASNLNMPGPVADPSKPPAAWASSSRLLPLNSDVWVLSLEIEGMKAHVRLEPQQWMARITGMVGNEEVTTDGPILRSVLMENLPVTPAG